MTTVPVTDFPSYVAPVAEYLRAQAALGAIQDRLTHQRSHGLPGDKDTVAVCLKHFDEYYSYSDDNNVWRRGNQDEQWLKEHDQWFGRNVKTATEYLNDQGLSPPYPKSEVHEHNMMRLKAFRRGITDAQWDRIILPVEKALLALDVYELPRSERTYTLPTDVWEGSRTHKVLAVPRSVRAAAEQARLGLNRAVEEGIPIDIWASCASNNEDEVYVVSMYRFHIYPNVPKL